MEIDRMKMMLLGTAREASTRCKNKMTRPFADTTLFDIYCKRFETLVKNYNTGKIFDGLGMAVSRSDKTLWDIAHTYDIHVVERNQESVSQGISKRSEELHFLNHRYYECYDYIFWLNGTLPFLHNNTIIDAAEKFRVLQPQANALTSVKQVYNWFWDDQGKPINNLDPTNVSTQGSPPLYETAHAFHIFDREHMMQNDAYWNLRYMDPLLYVIENERELIDIDTEDEFEYAEVVWKKTH